MINKSDLEIDWLIGLIACEQGHSLLARSPDRAVKTRKMKHEFSNENMRRRYGVRMILNVNNVIVKRNEKQTH